MGSPILHLHSITTLLQEKIDDVMCSYVYMVMVWLQSYDVCATIYKVRTEYIAYIWKEYISIGT